MGRRLAEANMDLIGLAGAAVFRLFFARQNPQLPPVELERFVRDFGCNREAKRTTLRQFREITHVDFFDGYDELLRTINRSVPNVTLWGDEDPYVPTRFAEQLFARETKVLPRVGHWVPIVAAARLADEVRRLR